MVIRGGPPIDPTISDVLTLSKELREEGQIDGQVKLYNVEEPDEFESDAATFFERTVLTDGLREALSILRDSLQGEQEPGTHVLYGSYGSGKSHQMVAYYHCFAAPDIASKWAEGQVDGLADTLPNSALPVTVSLQNSQPDYLWEPFFDALDYDSPEYDEGGYPTIETIEEAVGDRTVAYLVDELEDWFDTLEGDRLSANRGFLQALLEATDKDDLDLHVLVSVLREDSLVHDILNRQQNVEINMNEKVDKREILNHRLVESYEQAAVEEIVDGYIDQYKTADYVDMPSGLRDDMLETYPFHPVLIDSLETRYYSAHENQNTRGMIYLFSEVLLEMKDETDLLVHGDIDPRRFEDELARINFERLNAGTQDLKRCEEQDIKHGSRILNTILLYSLEPSEGEGVDKSGIVTGVYRTGDVIGDIIVGTEQLYGSVTHLHKLNGRYAIREKETPHALIKNAAKEVPEKSALSKIGQMVSGIFGQQAHPVGFRSDDLTDVPDNREIKIVVRSAPWTQEDVRTVITNGGRGRSWRNTLVFVQPERGEEIATGTGLIDKQRYVEGARQVLNDDSYEDSVHRTVERLMKEEKNELRNRLEGLYGEVLDGDDLLNEWDAVAEMDLNVYVSGGDPLNAQDIAEAAAADPLDLANEIWGVTEDLLERKGETTIQEIYEQFLREPGLPIPGDVSDVGQAASRALGDKPVLAHNPGGFEESFETCSADTTVVREQSVEEWDLDDVEEEIRSRFAGGETEVEIGEFELELAKRTDVWVAGEDLRDVVMRAFASLAGDNRYVLVSDTELLDKPKLDAALRDISDADEIGSDEVQDRILQTIEENGQARTRKVLGAIRDDHSVHLPGDETEGAFRQALTSLLREEHVIQTPSGFRSLLGDLDPLDVRLRPTAPDEIGDDIISYLDGLGEDEEFTVQDLKRRFDKVTEEQITTFLLQNLGHEEEPKYELTPSGSTDPADWTPGFGFRVPPESGWHFKYSGDDPADLRSTWRDRDKSGEVHYGTVSFNRPGDSVLADELRDAVAAEETTVNIKLESDQPYSDVTTLFERLPDDANDIQVEIHFE